MSEIGGWSNKGWKRGNLEISGGRKQELNGRVHQLSGNLASVVPVSESDDRIMLELKPS